MGPRDEMSPSITWTPRSSCLPPVMQRQGQVGRPRRGRGTLLAPDRGLLDFRTVRSTSPVFLSHPVGLQYSDRWEHVTHGFH